MRLVSFSAEMVAVKDHTGAFIKKKNICISAPFYFSIKTLHHHLALLIDTLHFEIELQTFDAVFDLSPPKKINL